MLHDEPGGLWYAPQNSRSTNLGGGAVASEWVEVEPDRAYELLKQVVSEEDRILDA